MRGGQSLRVWKATLIGIMETVMTQGHSVGRSRVQGTDSPGASPRIVLGQRYASSDPPCIQGLDRPDFPDPWVEGLSLECSKCWPGVVPGHGCISL